jgi:hypothetical protein
MREKTVTPGINLKLDDALKEENVAKYRLTRTEQQGLSFKDATKNKERTEDITYVREKQEFSEITLVAAIARYLNKPCLWLENILETTLDGMEKILFAVNEYNEILYDWVIPHLFKEFYEIDEYKKEETYYVELIKLSKDGYYTVTGKPGLTVRHDDPNSEPYQEKSFHLDTYCFDSNPEQNLFWKLLGQNKIKKVYFTGMLTHGQSEFFIQYIDPDSHTIRSYYPDFLIEKDDKTLVIIEVKGDNMIDDPMVRAKQEFAEQMAVNSGMVYRMIKGSDANTKPYNELFL